jgi:hypothetical protein
MGIRVVFALFVLSLLLIPSAAVADGHLPPIPVIGPRLSPPPIPHSDVLDNYVIYNNLLMPPPVQSQAANAAADAIKEEQEAPGRGIKQTMTGLGQGITLYAQSNVCNDFNVGGLWAASGDQQMTDIWTNWYAGWAPFAINHDYYQAQNTVFSVERVVGPGNSSGPGEYSAKISSYQPYAGGFGSPLITVPAGAEVKVSVDYLIFDHDTNDLDYDWASLGIKPDAVGGAAEYVNGYVRGEWAEMTHTIKAGQSGKIMVLIQGQSPAALNSNIYFDNVKIWVDGVALTNCTLE